MIRDDGGPAFPVTRFEQKPGAPDGHEHEVIHAGMSLRDWFAGRVIAQCQITVSVGKTPDAELVNAFAGRYAKTAYAIADAMLRARTGA